MECTVLPRRSEEDARPSPPARTSVEVGVGWDRASHLRYVARIPSPLARAMVELTLPDTHAQNAFLYFTVLEQSFLGVQETLFPLLARVVETDGPST